MCVCVYDDNMSTNFLICCVHGINHCIKSKSPSVLESDVFLVGGPNPQKEMQNIHMFQDLPRIHEVSQEQIITENRS